MFSAYSLNCDCSPTSTLCMQKEEPKLPVEKARLSHWIVHTKSRVVAAMEMHSKQVTAVAVGKVVMLQEWADKVDVLAAEVQERLGCIPIVGTEPAERK